MTKQHIFIIENNLQKVGQSFFHLSHRTTVIQDLLVRRQFSLVQDNRTNINVEAWKWSFKTGNLLKEVQFIWNFLWQDKKRWPFNAG